MIEEELGFFGNIWVRQTLLEQTGDSAGGHTHYHDHITLLTSGSVKVTVEGHEPRIFHAPTFIVIRKEHRHQIEALEDRTNFYCVFALRNLDGDVTDVYNDDNDPLCAVTSPDGYWDNVSVQRSRRYATIQGEHDEPGQSRQTSPTNHS